MITKLAADQTLASVVEELAEAEAKAWESLARYKFMMFGYWVGIWVYLNRISGLRRANPFARLVLFAREHIALAGGFATTTPPKA